MQHRHGGKWIEWLKHRPVVKQRWVWDTTLQVVTVGGLAAAAAAAAKSRQSYPTLCDPIDRSPPGSPLPGILQAQILEWVAMSSSRGSSRHRNWILVSHITGRFLLSEPPGKPRNTAVGSLSLLQGIFPNQESNWVLRHWRWILYQLSY